MLDNFFQNDWLHALYNNDLEKNLQCVFLQGEVFGLLGGGEFLLKGGFHGLLYDELSHQIFL
jgi:hypothetical protein